MKVDINKSLTIVLIIFISAVFYFPIFSHLDTLPLRLWDESRLAMNAYEMFENGNYLVTHFLGRPEMWNTKPPLMIWFQVAFMHLIGVNVLAVRLPSALAVLLTSIYLIFFTKKHLDSYIPGIAASLVLITSEGYLSMHSGRSGDYDALLSLFTSIGLLNYFIFIEKKETKYLYFTFLAFALAIYTKSIAGLIFVPAMFLYTIFSKNLKTVFANKHLYFSVIGLIILVSIYYFLREVYTPGYLEAVYDNELGGRYTTSLEGHKHGFWYFYENFLNNRFTYWFFLLPFGILIGIYSKTKKIKNLSIYLFLLSITFWFVVSFSETKLESYDVPLYPLMALMIAIAIHFFYKLLDELNFSKNNLRYNILPILFLFALFIRPYQNILDITYLPKDELWYQKKFEMTQYLKDASKGKEYINNQFLVQEGTNANNLFYLRSLSLSGKNIKEKNFREISVNDVVFTDQKKIKDYITTTYNFTILRDQKGITTYKIHGIK